VIVRLKLWARVVVLGSMCVAGISGTTENALGAARQQEPEADSNAQSGSSEKAKGKKEAKEKNNPEAASDGSGSDQNSISPSHHGFAGLGKDFLEDQKQIWTSPVRLRFADADWLVPVSGFAAGLFVTDRDVSTHLSNDPKTISHYNTLSNAGAAALIGGAGAMWLLSYPAHRDHWRETGFLAGEAAINSLVAVEALKYTLRRERPFQGDGSGPFFKGGTSFPSEHAAAAWAVAGVIAHEYPGPIPKILAYGLASLVDYSRIRARQHFPSDVFIGDLMGNMIAQDIYSRRHDPELGGGEWRPIRNFLHSGNLSPSNQGSPYVPLDSWIYPALDRLVGMGLIHSAFMGMRPWTRSECIRLVNEAEDRVSNSGDTNEAARLVELLQREFKAEAQAADEGGSAAFRLESAYSRTEHISGLPLGDGYYFGQTQINDFGRPYGEGWNTVNGLSAFATSGRWVGYLRAEEQSSPGIPELPLAAREFIQQAGPGGYAQIPSGTNRPDVTQVALLDAYVGLMVSNWEVTFGRQSLWWGPTEGGPLMFSDNAAPLTMFRINRVTPFKLPSILGWLGPLRVEFFLGQLRGQDHIFGETTGLVGTFGVPFSPQPMIHGERFTFKPTENFEFGLSRTSLFAGLGVPFTLHTFEQSLFSGSNGPPGSAADPGDRRSGIDWSYRLPKLRDWVTFYGEAFSEDEISPIAYMDKSVVSAGLYFSHIPGVPKLDLRAEGVYTDLPVGGSYINGYFYANDRYLSGYTSDNNLLGSWIGRDGQGAQAWTNYWFTSRNRIQLNFRHQKVSQQFVPQGGTLTDIGVRGDYWVRPNVELSASVQYGRWLYPILQPTANTNVSATVQISFQPQKLFQHPRNSDVTLSESGGRP
jgi:membrane-associated phospholipid phosphatase